jgi:hypothetical protein
MGIMASYRYSIGPLWCLHDVIGRVLFVVCVFFETKPPLLLDAPFSGWLAGALSVWRSACVTLCLSGTPLVAPLCLALFSVWHPSVWRCVCLALLCLAPSVRHSAVCTPRGAPLSGAPLSGALSGAPLSDALSGTLTGAPLSGTPLSGTPIQHWSRADLLFSSQNSPAPP